jgi:Ca2+-binding RTX toxin-like protein
MATITGTSGDDTLNGTSGADLIFGLAGNDILNGNGGNDQLDGGTGADTMSGGTGNDIYFVDDIGDSVNENSGEGTDQVRTTLAAYALGLNVEKLLFNGSGSFTGTGNSLNNEIQGGASSDTLYGNDGYDTLIGGGGADSLYGGNDGDLLDGGSGADYLEGNSGDDVYLVDNNGDSVVEAAGEGIDQVYTTLNVYTLGDNIENLNYNSVTGSFTATGNALDNIIVGSSSNDSISGLDGNDELRGNGGADTLSGGNGNDLLNGGNGADVMTGGADADTFKIGYFEAGTGAAADTITDFVSGTDIIDVSSWDANSGVGGNQAFSFIGSSAFSSTAGELRADTVGSDTVVQGDINGDGIADFEIVLNGNPTLAGSDFIL